MSVRVELSQSSTQRISNSQCGKRSPARMEPSVIFLLRFALKRANLKSHKMFGLADTRCFDVYLRRVAPSDARIESRRQIMYVTQFTPRNIVDKFNDSLDFSKLCSAESTAAKRQGRDFEQSKSTPPFQVCLRKSLTMCHSYCFS